jgi:hypothetical protein
MFETVSLDRALCLPAPDIAALLHGQLIAAIPHVPVQKGWIFSLYPLQISNTFSINQYYRSHILPLARTAISQQQSEVVEIEAWAKCELFKVLYDVEQLETLSSLSIWTKETLKHSLKQRQRVFLAFLRVYRVPDCIKVASNAVTPDKLGKFVSLSALDKQFNTSLKIKQVLPVLNDTVFSQRMKQLEELRPSLDPELEELQSLVAELFTDDPSAQRFENEIKSFLGWANTSIVEESDPNLGWIDTIVAVGNSSDGYEFEKLVRKSLIELGFSNSLSNSKASLDPEATGGPGGIDVYCDSPFPLVGECKASKHESVPNSVSAQLIHSGNTHLGNLQFNKSVKVIFASGKLTDAAQQAAVGNEINIMRPETLKRLVEVKTKHQGSIDLIDLKPYLQRSPFGEGADEKVNQYIDLTLRKLRMRSHIVQSVKQLTKPEKRQLEVTEIMTCYNIKFAESNGMLELDKQTVHELLIELASPLTGYLGRIRGTSIDSDRFYFLRDLPVD